MLHQRGELGLLAVQEASDECLLKKVHKVNQPQPAAQLLCRMEGSITNHKLTFIIFVFLLRQTPTNRTWWIWLLALDSFPKQILTAALWFISGQR